MLKNSEENILENHKPFKIKYITYTTQNAWKLWFFIEKKTLWETNLDLAWNDFFKEPISDIYA